MRSFLFIALVSISACAAQQDVDSSDQLDAPAGKEDAAAKPAGAYTNNGSVHAGELASLSLNADHTFTATLQVECIAAPCNPVVETGTFLFTHGPTKRYIRLYAEDGSSIDRYQWKLTLRGDLQLEQDGSSHWFSMTSDGVTPEPDTSCAADTDCSGILPQFCRQCSDGSTSCAHWSCVENACQIATCN